MFANDREDIRSVFDRYFSMANHVDLDELSDQFDDNCRFRGSELTKNNFHFNKETFDVFTNRQRGCRPTILS